jgi:hypothetical protein
MKECLRKERKMGKRLIKLLYLPVIAVQEKAQGGNPEREGLPGVDGYVASALIFPFLLDKGSS